MTSAVSDDAKEECRYHTDSISSRGEHVGISDRIFLCFKVKVEIVGTATRLGDEAGGQVVSFSSQASP
jgi:hypothetical protein